MRCPFCGHEDRQDKDSRPTEDNSAIRRRRQCEACGARFTTFERIQLRELTVVKSEGRREAFEREKLERSVTIACRKRPIDSAGIDKMVSAVQRQLEYQGDNDVPSADIGILVMEALRQLDSVAYIRFVSVHREFSGARDFEEFAASVRALGGE